jgi:hypothetical protein
MKRTIATVVIEFDGEHEEDTIRNAIDYMIGETLNTNETYNVVEIEYIDE